MDTMMMEINTNVCSISTIIHWEITSMYQKDVMMHMLLMYIAPPIESIHAFFFAFCLKDATM